jgi:hypothetical protein
VLRVSFGKVLDLVRPMWLMLGFFDDLVTDHQKDQFLRRVYNVMGRCVTAKRRSRSCPRAVRQPVSRWPRLLHNESVKGPLHFEIL